MVKKYPSKLFAKGRLKAGQMNKTEAAYAKFLESEKFQGRVAAYWFEALTIKIAENRCSYTPDFLVQRPSGELELHEVKGSKNPAVYRDDAKVKAKVCADRFPFKFFVVTPKSKKAGAGWDYLEY